MPILLDENTILVFLKKRGIKKKNSIKIGIYKKNENGNTS